MPSVFVIAVETRAVDIASGAQILRAMEIIAERMLTLEAPGQQPSTIRVIVGKPVEAEEGEWIAPYEIHGPGDEVWKFGARGIDAWQALRLTLWFLPQDIQSRFGSRGTLTHEGNADWRADPPPTPEP